MSYSAAFSVLTPNMHVFLMECYIEKGILGDPETYIAPENGRLKY